MKKVMVKKSEEGEMDEDADEVANSEENRQN